MIKIQYKPLSSPLNMLFKVEVFEKTKNKDTNSNRLFDLQIFPQKTSFWTGEQCIEIWRKPILTDGLHNNNNTDAFVHEVSTVLHQLTLKLGFTGMPVKVEQQNELWKNWLAIRANLSIGYTGDWISSALTTIDKKMLPGETLMNHIMQDLFMNEYFRGVYDAVFTENKFSCNRKISGLCPWPIQFNEIWTLQNAQVIKFSGEGNNPVDQSEINGWLKSKTGESKAEISVDGFYQFDHNTAWCNALESNYSLTANNYEKKIKISLTTN